MYRVIQGAKVAKCDETGNIGIIIDGKVHAVGGEPKYDLVLESESIAFTSASELMIASGSVEAVINKLLNRELPRVLLRAYNTYGDEWYSGFTIDCICCNLSNETTVTCEFHGYNGSKLTMWTIRLTMGSGVTDVKVCTYSRD